MRRPGTIAIAGLLAFGLCVPATARLYGDLRTDLRELLPHGAPAAVGLEELEKRVGGFSSLAIVVRTDDLKSGERFVDALVAKLQQLPPSTVARIFWRVDAERAFFESHGALFADTKDLLQIRDSLKAQVARVNPLLVDLDDDHAATGQAKSSASTDAALARLRGAFARIDRYPDGYLAGEGGHTLVVSVFPPGAAVSLDDDQIIFRAVEQVVREVDPSKYGGHIKVGYGGEIRSVIEAQEALVRDLQITGVLVLLAVGLALVLYYQTLRALPLLVLPLFTGVSLTFALSRAVIHYLNPNTAFLGSIIVGNGINAGIILLARYLEERRRGKALPDALPLALRGTWTGTFVASAAAAASYGSLGFVSFRGFNQFAFMGFFGMLFCWLSTYSLMPALIVLVERLWPFHELSTRKHPAAVGWIAGRFAALVVRRPAWAVALTAVLAVGSGFAMVRFLEDPIQYDFRKLGSRSGIDSGAGYWDKHVDAVLQSYQTPTVVLTDSAESAEAVAASVDKEREFEGPQGTIESVTSLQKLLPVDQPRKLALLSEIFAILDQKPSAMPPEIARLRQSTKLTPVGIADIPARLTEPFFEKDGHSGRLVLVFPTLSTDSANGLAQIAHSRAVREASWRVDKRARVAGQIVLTTDIVGAITSEGGLTALLSFLAVSLLTLLVLRSLRDAAWVIGSLTLGMLWMAGLMSLLSLKLNFVNFAVLPITFGIGVDYAVNLYQRYKQTRSVEDALGTSGGAVALCSLTTIIGYATLIAADNQAIQSFGLTAVLGEVTCLSAALFALPALLSLRDRKAPVLVDTAQHQGA